MKLLDAMVLSMVLLAAAAPAAAAQQVEVAVGQRVRFLAPDAGFGSSVVGDVRSFERDTLVLELAGTASRGMPGLETRVPFSDILQLDVREGPRNQVLTGGTGLLLGAGLGFVASRLHRNFSVSCAPHCSGRAYAPEYDDRVTTGIIAGSAAVGLLVGVAVPGDQWSRGTLPRGRAGTLRSGTQMGVALRR